MKTQSKLRGENLRRISNDTYSLHIIGQMNKVCKNVKMFLHNSSILLNTHLTQTISLHIQQISPWGWQNLYKQAMDGYLSICPPTPSFAKEVGRDRGREGWVCMYVWKLQTHRQTPFFLLYGYFHVPGIALTAFYCLEWSSYTLINLPPPLPHLVTWDPSFRGFSYQQVHGTLENLCRYQLCSNFLSWLVS